MAFLDSKRDVKGTYSAFRFWGVFRENIKNFCSVVPHSRLIFKGEPSQPSMVLPLGWHTRSRAKCSRDFADPCSC